jgi:transmembrane sensor
MRQRPRRFNAIESQAAAWLARRDGGMTAGEKAEFDRWCAADPRHSAAVNEIAAVWTAFDHPVASGQFESLRAELQARDRRDRHRWMAGGVAATLAAAAGLAVFFEAYRPFVSKPAAVLAATALVVEPERQILIDGSIVVLRPGAKITVAFSAERRVVILEQGEAHFSVMKDAQKPFIVQTGTVKVTAVGTAFAVGLHRGEVEVLVTEGRVRIASSPPMLPVSADAPPGDTPAGASAAASTPIVEAGQRAVVPLGTTVSISTVVSVPVADLAARLSWRLPRFEFSETSVADAIAMFNRHNQLQLQAGDEAAAARRITGVFRSDNVEGFVRALESGLGLVAERRESEILVRSAP